MSLLPEGWVKFAERWESTGARKWFGDHYKEVVVANDGGDLAAAAAAVDQEVALRTKATVDAANAHADSLEAQAAAIRDAGDVTATPTPQPEEAPPVDAVHETVEPVKPVVVPTIEELRAEADKKLEAEITELEAKDSASADPTAEAVETPAEASA
jgi:BMFP domain-containing protein YqiC